MPQCRVLVTEDDPELRKLLAMALKRRRIEVETAANGEEAIRFLATTTGSSSCST